MPDTGYNLVKAAETFTEDDSIKSANGLLWINEFLDILGSDAMIYSTQDYVSSTSKTWYNLPITCDSVHRVDEYSGASMLDSEFEDKYAGYEVLDTKIKFSDDGHYRLRFFIKPTKLTAITENVVIDESFYMALKLYVAYRQLTFDDEDNAAPNTLGRERYQQFQMALGTAVNDRKKKFKTKRRIRMGRR